MATKTDKKCETRIYIMPWYQAQMLYHEFAQRLKVVIIHKTNLQTGACAHVILCSSDLELSYAKIVDSYRLRFQQEFNFRAAKQYWGLADWQTG